MIEVNNQTKSKIDLALIKKTARLLLSSAKINNKEISIALVGDRLIKELNRKYRGLNKITDVLSFAGDQDFLGEIIIDYAQIKRQAKKYGTSAKDELIYILVHGLLHLLGHDDETGKGWEKMEKLAVKFIKNLKD